MASPHATDPAAENAALAAENAALATENAALRRRLEVVTNFRYWAVRTDVPSDFDRARGVCYTFAPPSALWALAAQFGTPASEVRRMIAEGLDPNASLDGRSLLGEIVQAMFSGAHPAPAEAQKTIELLLASGARYVGRHGGDRDAQLAWCWRDMAWPICELRFPHLEVLELLSGLPPPAEPRHIGRDPPAIVIRPNSVNWRPPPH